MIWVSSRTRARTGRTSESVLELEPNLVKNTYLVISAKILNGTTVVPYGRRARKRGPVMEMPGPVTDANVGDWATLGRALIIPALAKLVTQTARNEKVDFGL